MIIFVKTKTRKTVHVSRNTQKAIQNEMLQTDKNYFLWGEGWDEKRGSFALLFKY